VTRFGSVSDFAIRHLLQKYGLEPVRDVPLVQIGGQPEQAAALSKRLIYAAAIFNPRLRTATQSQYLPARHSFVPHQSNGASSAGRT